MRLYLVASRPTDAVTHGFLPAAARLGLDVTVLTDQQAAHGRVYAERPAVPTVAGEPGECPPPRVVSCDVWDHRELIGALTALPAPDAVLSNSDHLQSQTALAAGYLGLPGKDWRSALRAKYKPLMRRTLAGAGIERVRVTEIRASELRASEIPDGADPVPAGGLPYPVVLKPADGVASEDVVLAADPEQFRRYWAGFFRRRPGGALMAEEFLPGTLRTMETLGDGVTRWVLGGYRVIGDHCEFLLAHLTGLPLFELILRGHLGERLPKAPPAPPPGREHAAADYILAGRPGLLAEVPPAARHERPGISLAHWPLSHQQNAALVTPPGQPPRLLVKDFADPRLLTDRDESMVTAGTLTAKEHTGAADVNKHYGAAGPNYLKGDR